MVGVGPAELLALDSGSAVTLVGSGGDVPVPMGAARVELSIQGKEEVALPVGKGGWPAPVRVPALMLVAVEVPLAGKKVVAPVARHDVGCAAVSVAWWPEDM